MAFATGKSASDGLFRTNINCNLVSADGRSMVIDDDRVCSRSHLLLDLTLSLKNLMLATHRRLKFLRY